MTAARVLRTIAREGVEPPILSGLSRACFRYTIRALHLLVSCEEEIQLEL